MPIRFVKRILEEIKRLTDSLQTRIIAVRKTKLLCMRKRLVKLELRSLKNFFFSNFISHFTFGVIQKSGQPFSMIFRPQFLHQKRNFGWNVEHFPSSKVDVIYE